MHHLEPDAVVVRGGRLGDVPLLMKRALGAAFPDPDGVGFASLSVRARNIENGEDVGSVVFDLCKIPSDMIRVSSAARLFDVGLDLVKTRDDPHHYSVPTDPERLQETIETFIECFDPPIQNPRK